MSRLARLAALLVLLPFAALAAAQDAPPAPSTELLEAADPAELAELREADLRLRARLSSRLAAIPGLEKARVEVTGGIVTLRGEAVDDGRRQLAATIAGQADGVVHVDNQLGIDTDVAVRAQPVLEHIGERLRGLLAALPLLVVAAVIVALAWWLGARVARLPLPGRRRNPFVEGLLRQALHGAVLVTGILVALDLLNATALVGALLGAAGVVGIALGFAFRDIAENYIAGILLSLRQPFAPHDHVVVDRHEGRVAALTPRATVLVTEDGNHLRLPNALVFKSVILNYTHNPLRRLQFEVRLKEGDSVSAAQAAALACLRDIEGILADPAPAVVVTAVAGGGANLVVSAWVNQRDTSHARALSEAMRLVRRRLADGGANVPTQPEAPGASLANLPDPIDRQVDLEASAREDNLLDPNARRE
ncbi:MAG: mechanosensitive ion channel domain-containing protein [Lysobacteraceae bacterium]